MCVIFIAHQVHPDYPLIIAANRDEFFDRPTEPMRIWTDGFDSSHGLSAEVDDVSSISDSPRNDAGNGDSSSNGFSSTDNEDCGEDRFYTQQQDGEGGCSDHSNSHHFHPHRPTRRRSRKLSLAGQDLIGGGTWLGLAVSPNEFPKLNTTTEECCGSDCVDCSGSDCSESDRRSDTIFETDCEANDDDTEENPRINQGANINHTLRWIALTNFRGENYGDEHGRPSRGGLLLAFLELGSAANEATISHFSSAESFVSELQRSKGQEYNGFNVLVGDGGGVYYYGNKNRSNHSEEYEKFMTENDVGCPQNQATTTTSQHLNEPQPLPPGIYGLSNALLDTPWPKVERGKEMLNKLCQNGKSQTPRNKSDDNEDGPNDSHFSEESNSETNKPSSLDLFHEHLMHILQDKTRPNDKQLPKTGLDLEAERYLSSIFIPKGHLRGKEYGTRCSTTVILQPDGKVSVLERTWPDGKDRKFNFECKNVDA